MKITLTVVLLTAAGLGADDRKDPPNDGHKAFQGKWKIVEAQVGGKKTDMKATGDTVVFSGNTYTIMAGMKVLEEGTFQLDAAKTPNYIVATATSGMDKGKKWHGIYELEGDTLRAVVGPVDKARPMQLTKPPVNSRGFTLKRTKPAKP